MHVINEYPSVAIINLATFVFFVSIRSYAVCCRYSLFRVSDFCRRHLPEKFTIHNYIIITSLHNVNHNLSAACDDKSWFIDKNIHLKIYSFTFNGRKEDEERGNMIVFVV